jgi:hypothetical protein
VRVDVDDAALERIDHARVATRPRSGLTASTSTLLPAAERF